jgi:hypothetical protein
LSSKVSRILILCKTYPSPSGKHVETSCIAGVDEAGSLIRLFPVPFRLIGGERQFKKWQWIRARIDRASNDRRPESHKVFVDTIQLEGEPLSTRNGWAERLRHLGNVPIFESFDALQAARQERGVTLGLLRPSRMIGLDVAPAENPTWTPGELEKLLQHERQFGLFSASDAKSISTLRKLPFDFHYRYVCLGEEGERQFRHKIADWEVGALFWNCRKGSGDSWQVAFREKLETELPSRDLMFLMGTIHRFPDQWMIVSLIYPPRRQPEPPAQGSLFDP